VVAVAVGLDLLSRPAEERTTIVHLFDWIRVGSFSAGADLRVDQFSVLMILVVTIVGTLIHLYAIGYREGDPRLGRFFAYLNLFVFFMSISSSREPAPAVRRVGGRGLVLVPADRVLARADRRR
jgi:NADH-quinone oxidoreductase subunit L